MKRWFAVLVVAGVVVVLLLAVAGWELWRHPLRVDAWLSRRALAHAGLRRRTISGPNGRIVVWEGGHGPLLVLLHGAGDQAGTWSKVVPGLVGRYRLAVPDLPGHGESAPSSGPITVGMEVRGVEAVLRTVSGHRPAILIGNSLGAWVATLVAFAHPDRVSRLVLVNGGPIRGEAPPSSLQPSNRAEARRVMEMLMGPEGRAVPGFVLDDVVRQAHSGPLGRLESTAGGMGTYLLEGKLARLETPTDLLWGAADRFCSLSYAQRMLKQLPAARLTALPGCGHLPQRLCPAAFTRALLNILGSPPPTARGEDHSDQR